MQGDNSVQRGLNTALHPQTNWIGSGKKSRNNTKDGNTLTCPCTSCKMLSKLFTRPRPAGHSAGAAAPALPTVPVPQITPEWALHAAVTMLSLPRFHTPKLKVLERKSAACQIISRGKTVTIAKNTSTLSAPELPEQPSSGTLLWKPFRPSACRHLCRLCFMKLCEWLQVYRISTVAALGRAARNSTIKTDHLSEDGKTHGPLQVPGIMAVISVTTGGNALQGKT